MRHCVARAAALRAAGRAGEAVAMARRAVEAAVAGDCPALEHGLALVEAARCHAAAGEAAEAVACRDQARAVWRAGQVDAAVDRALPDPTPEPLAAEPRRPRFPPTRDAMAGFRVPSRSRR